MVKLVTVLGNRPQFIKAAIVGRRWREHWPNGELSEYLVHTGQHYDPMLSDVFFDQLGIAAPDVNLKVGSGPILDQIGVMLPMLRKVFEEQKPDGILVYGDTNSTVAAALTAAHLHIPLFHVEAGERNYRRLLAPEEVNRVVTDELAWLCLTSTEKATEYLLREGYARERVVRVGDPMFDLFCWATPLVDANATVTPRSLGLAKGGYVLATIHRNENTASGQRLIEVLDALDAVSMPVVLPLHPRVRNLLKELGWAPKASLRLIDPVGYFDVLALLRDCAVCVTDSGGLSREAFFSGKPSVVPLPNSGWNEIVEAGWLKVVPRAGEALTGMIDGWRPDAPLPQGLFGDGFAARRIGEVILETLGSRGEEGAWHPLGRFENIPQPHDESGNSLQAYRETLAVHREGGVTFVPVSRATAAGKSTIGLRHDVELGLEDAVGMARVEADMGVTASYFIRMDGVFFNPMAADARARLAEIAGLGHDVGVLARGLEPDLLAAAKAVLKQVTGKPAAEDVELPEFSLEEFYGAGFGDGTVLLLSPNAFAVQPMSPFEKGQRIVSRALERLRADPSLVDLMRR